MTTLLKICLVLLLSICVPASAQKAVKCLSCRPIMVELRSAKAMLEYVTYAQDDDAERKRVLDQLMHWVIESKEYDVGLEIAGRFYSWSGGQKESVDRMLGKEGLARLRAFLSAADSPSQLSQAMRYFREEAAYDATERELMCAKIIKGSDIEALEGFESGCRFGHYADTLRARLLTTKDKATIKRLKDSDFGRLFFTFNELLPFLRLVQ